MSTHPHFYEIISDGQKYHAGIHNSMAEVLKFPSLDAHEDCEKETVFEGTGRAYMAWVCRLLCGNKANDFSYRRLNATKTSQTFGEPDPIHLTPPVHREQDPVTGDLLDVPINGSYTVVIRTPGGPPNKAVRETLRGHRLYWNPNDARGNAEYPSPAWLRHHVPAPELPAFRKLAADLRLEFDYLDKNPVKQ